MDRNLKAYLPEVLKNVREFNSIAEVEQAEIEKLWCEIENILNDQFIESATENGVKRFEKILKLVPKATDTLEKRKFRILTRFNEQIPYTMSTLDSKLKTLCGENGYTLELVSDAYKVVKVLLMRTVPVNMIVDLSLLYNKHELLGRFTHLQLSKYSHDGLRNEVM